MSDEQTQAPVVTEVVPSPAPTTEAVPTDVFKNRLAEKDNQIAELQGKLEELSGVSEKYQVLSARVPFLEHGIRDPEEQDMLQYRYSKLDAEKRPPISEWLQKGALEDRIASRILQPPAQPTADPSPAPQQPRQPTNYQDVAIQKPEEGVNWAAKTADMSIDELREYLKTIPDQQKRFF